MQSVSSRISTRVAVATLVEGYPKASFSIATKPRCREGATPFPGLLHFTFDPYLIVLRAKQYGIKNHFLSLWSDSTWDRTSVSRTIGEHSTQLTNYYLKTVIKIAFKNVFRNQLIDPRTYVTGSFTQYLDRLTMEKYFKKCSLH